MTSKHTKARLLIVWLVAGPFGGHRFYLHQKEAYVFLYLAIFQAVLLNVILFQDPLLAWPPYCAVANVRVLLEIWFPSDQFIEHRDILPLSWILYLPATILMIATLVDGFLLLIRGSVPDLKSIHELLKPD